MSHNRLTSAAATLAMCFVVAAPGFAQEGHRSGGRARGEGQARGENRPSAVPRSQAVPRNDLRFDGRFNGPRGGQFRSGPPHFDERFYGGRFGEHRFDQRRFVAPRVIRPGIGFGQPYYRPYYSFRPRLSLGFGLWMGYPILYSAYGPSYYPDPYTSAYASPYPATTYPATRYPNSCCYSRIHARIVR